MNRFHLALICLFLLVSGHLPAAEENKSIQKTGLIPVRSTAFSTIQEELAGKKLRGELEFQQLLLKQLEEYIAARPEAGDLAAAYFEMIRLYGERGEFSSARKILKRLSLEKPGDQVMHTARLELARTLLTSSDDSEKIKAVDSALADAYGYAHETRLRQNLASVLALNGNSNAARRSLTAIRNMSLYREYPMRFKSMEIYVDYLSRIGAALT